jgi:hypothetical protein
MDPRTENGTADLSCLTDGDFVGCTSMLGVFRSWKVFFSKFKFQNWDRSRLFGSQHLLSKQAV